jgi:predicted PurR-regulated permease PerM
VFTVCGGVLAVVAVVLFVMRTLVAITLTAAALMIAVALDHVVAQLVKRGVRRWLAVGAVTLAAMVLLAGFFLVLFPPVIGQTKQLVANWPQLHARLEKTKIYVELLRLFGQEANLKTLVQRLPELVSGSAGSVMAILGGMLNAVAGAITIFFLAVFMLIFGGRVVDAMLAESTPERRDRYQEVVLKIYNLIGGYLSGLFLICGINATAASIFMAIVGVPFFLPLGMASGFSSLVPYAGPVVMGTLITGLAAITGGPWKGLACAIYFVLYGQLEGNVLGPLVFRRTVHVNPLVVLLSIVFFSEIAGLVGAVMAVPVAAALQVVLREVLRIRRERLDLAKTAMNTPTDTT